jgi:RNA polymerase sigma-70 factor, ECF subfamily
VSTLDTDDDFARLTSPYRRELVAHCYRMIGSLQDAEDLVQETLLRGWRAYGAFDGRSSVRTWLYRIATNACLTSLAGSHRREFPSGLAPATSDSRDSAFERMDSVPWIGPAPTTLLSERPDDPASIVSVRDSTRLALIVAFQRLPARQRAALILIDVAGFTPAETAAALDITVTTARSLIQRARSTLAADRPIQDQVVAPASQDVDILRQYMSALENGDVEQLASLLRADVQFEMPPFPIWFGERKSVVEFHERLVFQTPHRAIATSANGFPAAASYAASPNGGFEARSIHVIEAEHGEITRVSVFLDKSLFTAFGLPNSLRSSLTDIRYPGNSDHHGPSTRKPRATD